MRNLFTFLAGVFTFLGLAFTGSGADLVTATITSTNLPADHATITINGSTRTWTNNPSASLGTQIHITNSIAGCMTNLLNHLTVYPAATWHILSTTSSTNASIRGRVGEALTVTAAGNWAQVTYATQTVASPTLLVRVPGSVETPANQINIGSGLVELANKATNSLATNAAAMAHFITKGASATQTITAPLVLEQLAGGTNKGTIYGGRFSGGTVSNATIHATGSFNNGFSTNLTVSGLQVPGSGASTLQIGNTAVASGDYAVALGDAALASGIADVAIGTTAECGWGDSVAIGTSAAVNAASGVSIGYGSAVGANHRNSVAIGAFAVTSSSNQITLGSATHHISVPGRIDAATLTNATTTGTNRNIGIARQDVQTISTLAIGNNTLPALTSALAELTTTGGAFAIVGIPAGAAGQTLRLVNLTGQNMTLAHESGVDPTAGNRIVTMTGSDVATTGNGTAELYYSASQSRWILVSSSP